MSTGPIDPPSPGAAPVPMARWSLNDGEAKALAPVFKALGDPVRLQLLSMIVSAAGGEACVCELTGPFPLTGPTISHHLKVLREAGLVDSERRGTWVYYRPRPAAVARLAAVLTSAGAPVAAAAP